MLEYHAVMVLRLPSGAYYTYDQVAAVSPGVTRAQVYTNVLDAARRAARINPQLVDKTVPVWWSLEPNQL
ncbi:hypothetical protein [Salinactinospora qingdaonensis]|uniref:Uncharacterized protein n=1 Tax=Salinactinospora qingdaonensis TaxID=702744 RepID=A0ABP7F504_9ACTN